MKGIGSRQGRLFARRYFLNFFDDEFVGRPVRRVLSNVHVADATVFVEYKDRGVSDASMLRRIQDAVRYDDLVVFVGQELELRSGGLAHRPGKFLFVNADGNQIRARLLYLVVVLSQPGELRRAGGSPEPAIEDEDDRAPSRIIR